MGRPSKYDNIDLEQVERLAGLGLIDREIAYVLDISEVTLNKYKKTPEFLKSLKKGKIVADRKVTESLYERALGYTHPEEKIFTHNGEIIRANTIKQYPPDSTALIFWLKNRRPDLWKDKNAEFIDNSKHYYQEVKVVIDDNSNISSALKSRFNPTKQEPIQSP